MVSLLDRLIAEAVIENKAVISYSIAGKSVNRSLSEARQLREYYRKEAIAAAGGFAVGYGEAIAE